MANPNAVPPECELVEPLTLTDLCQICGLSADWIIELVEEGILEPMGDERSVWRFETTSITIVRKVQRLQVDLRINIPGIAVVLALVDENTRLKRALLVQEADAE